MDFFGFLPFHLPATCPLVPCNGRRVGFAFRPARQCPVCLASLASGQAGDLPAIAVSADIPVVRRPWRWQAGGRRGRNRERAPVK